MTKAAWPREPSSRSTEAITTWTSAMPPLVAQAFWPLITHSSFASSYLAVVRIAETSEPASGSDAQKAATFGSSAAAEALRNPLAELLGGSLPEDRGDGERGAEDAHPDPGVAPEELLVDDRQRRPGLVGPELGQPFEAVETDLGGLLDHRPGRFLALVPFRGGGPDGVLGEAVHPLADVLLVLVQLEREPRPARWSRRGIAGGFGDDVFGGGLGAHGSHASMLHDDSVDHVGMALPDRARESRLRGRAGRRRAGPRRPRRRSRRSGG